MQQALYDNESAYWEERLGDDVPLNSVGYRGLSDAYVSWLYRVRRARFTAMVRPLARPDMRVLDVGSGGGFYIELWRRMGVHDITATDLTQASVRAIKRRFPAVSAAQLDIGSSAIPFERESFDAISCMDVLHHLMDDDAYARAISNCAAMLRPRGALIFTDNFLNGPAYRGPHHVSRPLVQIESILRRAGMHVTARRPMFVVMNNPIDSRNGLFKFYWKAMSFISENPCIGAVTGAMLYPFELALTSLIKEGPSTEICIATKR
jgi:2-polyprenyl-3-methyl-5-hydroxy-6-metoxy-1,4-benzoquinol methylase